MKPLYDETFKKFCDDLVNAVSISFAVPKEILTGNYDEKWSAAQYSVLRSHWVDLLTDWHNAKPHLDGLA